MIALRKLATNLIKMTWVIAVALTFFAFPAAQAQVAGATLSGTVTDSSGAIIVRAEIAITNVATGIVTSATSNSDGFYSAPNLLVGGYQMTVTAPGFVTQVRNGINLTVGAQQALNFTLQVGQVSQRVDVTGEAPTVQLASSDLSAVVDSKTVVELPLNGRDWTQLATLQPGVNTVLTQAANNPTAHRGTRGNGSQLTISGTRPQLNNYRLDGISIVDYAGGGPGGVLGVTLGVDAVGEFSVLTANYSAEYGRTSGGVINAITRSGSNGIHGTAYWFLRDEGLDAKNYFDKTIAPFHRNQFGGSLGGPIRKDKTFFFADYEGFREATGLTNLNNVPSQDARNGILHNANGTTTNVTVDPSIAAYLAAFYPLPNAGLLGVGNTGVYRVGLNNINHEDFVTAKIDHKFSNTDNISGTWLRDSASKDLPDTYNEVLSGNTSVRQTLSVEETHSFTSALVNTVRGGFNRVAAIDSLPLKAINPLTQDLSLGSFAGRPAPQMSVSGLTAFAGGFNGPGAANNVWNSFQGYDDAFLIKGVHSLKFGFAVERMQLNATAYPRPNGAFTFGSLTAFLTNAAGTSFIGSPPNSANSIGARASLFAGYFQDDWKLRPNLTLNLGLRYETASIPSEVSGKLSNLRNFTDPTPTLGSPYINNPTRRNFEPRVGFSWDPFRDGKTAVRAAFGIFDVLPLNYEFAQNEKNAYPFSISVTASNLAAGSFPTQAANGANIIPSKLQFGSIQFNPSRNYVMIWNLNVQRQLTPNTTLTLGYVGNHGVHMLDREEDNNSVLPIASTPEGLIFPTPGTGTRLNPNVGAIRAMYWTGDSEYDAFQAMVVKKMSHGLQLQGSYTWGKNIDTGSASVVGDPFTNSIADLYFFCKSCRRGLSDFNIAHSLSISYLWDLPTLKRLPVAASYLLGGWQLGGIITLQTGVPFTPILGGDPLGLGSQGPAAFPNRISGSGCDSPVNAGNANKYIKVKCFTVPMATPEIAALCTPFKAVPGSCANLVGDSGRNSVIGPGLVDSDLSLIKNTKIVERLTAQFRVEFFNIFNRANFAVPVANSTLFDQNGNPVAGAGKINLTSTTARQIQLALKLIW